VFSDVTLFMQIPGTVYRSYLLGTSQNWGESCRLSHGWVLSVWSQAVVMSV
jgi:hypothetical protein